MSSAEALFEPNLQSLPEDLLNRIGSRLKEWDVCSMEIASKRLHSVLSRPSHDGSHETRLFLTAVRYNMISPNPKNFRWIQERVRRYSHINCNFYNTRALRSSAAWREAFARCAVPPLLTSLLAACAPSAELSLFVQSPEGEWFLGLLSWSIEPGARPELLSFWANIKQHLTTLTLELNHGRGRVYDLEILGMLTALRTLTFGGPLGLEDRNSCRNISGQKLVLKLPHLVTLHLKGLQECEVIVACPKLTEIKLRKTASVHVSLKESVLERLDLRSCQDFQFSVKDQLHSLKSLSMTCEPRAPGVRNKVDRLPIEDFDQMTRLQELALYCFPPDCMPERFPKNLRLLYLFPSDWCHGLPEGLKELTLLESLVFEVSWHWDSWSNTQPLAEIIPLDNLKTLSIGVRSESRYYRSKRCGGEGFPKYLEVVGNK